MTSKHIPGRTDLSGIADRIKSTRGTQDAAAFGFHVFLYRHESIDVESTLRHQWVRVEDRLPTHNYSVLAWIVGGSLHHGQDYFDVASYIPNKGGWRTSVGEDDITVQVSHWRDIDAPEGKVRL